MIEFEIFGEIGTEITVENIKNFLNVTKGKQIRFKVASLGGDLAQAITIHNLIKTHKGKTTAEIIGLTASAGTVIAIACNEVIMHDNALFLIHNGWTSMTGNAYDMQKTASDLIKNDAIMIKIYREKTGLDAEKVQELMKSEDWLSPAEAEQYGFIDSIISTGQKIAANMSKIKGLLKPEILTKLENKMKKFKNKASNAYLLPLADGENLIMNAEEATQGVEVQPLGALTLDDGEYKLEDGRTIIVSGGVITEVKEAAGDGDLEAAEEETVEAIAEMLVESEDKMEKMIDSKIEALKKVIGSTHTPKKGITPITTPKAQQGIDDIQDKVEEKKKEIRAKKKERIHS